MACELTVQEVAARAETVGLRLTSTICSNVGHVWLIVSPELFNDKEMYRSQKLEHCNDFISGMGRGLLDLAEQSRRGL